MTCAVYSIFDHPHGPDYLKPFRSWQEAMARVDFADARERVAWAEFLKAQTDFGKESPQAEGAYAEFAACFPARVYSRAMMTPAPDAKALRWKNKARKIGGGHPLWDNAIAADEERLARKKRRAVNG